MMRCPTHLELYRRKLRGFYGDSYNGYMLIPARGLAIIFSNGGGWEHVSVSRNDRVPTWDEMEWVKREFWEDTDTVMQLHVPPAEHVNHHEYCLHLWRPATPDVGTIPRPPSYMIA